MSGDETSAPQPSPSSKEEKNDLVESSKFNMCPKSTIEEYCINAKNCEVFNTTILLNLFIHS